MHTSLIAFTDGACRGNPGRGGWGVILYSKTRGSVRELGAHAPHTTNNRMELEAAIGALEALSAEIEDLTLCVDSKYVIQGVTEWVRGWELRGWVSSSGSPVANPDLWEQLIALVRARERKSKIHWQHVLGHAGIPGNERADQIAQAFADGTDIKLYEGSFDDYGVDILTMSSKASEKKKTSTKSSSKKAYLYLSLVAGQLERHKTWDECSARVKGVARAKFKKVLSPEEEQSVLQEWGIH